MITETKCSDHPDAPHGFDRNGSHSVGHYVCECEGWMPEPMTTKDQAIARQQFEAWAKPILGDNPTWRESGDCELAWQAWKAQQPTPDCRTCVKAWPTLNGCSHNCTNGDKYKAAPAVVLWRTE